MQIVAPCVVVLVGPSGSGKSTWAQRHFEPSEIVSSDALRAAVGLDEFDQRASPDAFAVLAEIVSRRIGRRLTTVVDTLGFSDEGRRSWIDQAKHAGLPVYAITFTTEPKVCRARNKKRARPVPAKVLTSQLQRFEALVGDLGTEGFTAVVDASVPIRLVNRAMGGAAAALDRQSASPVSLDFGLQISDFRFATSSETMGSQLTEIARAAEAAGFSSLWVMDHMMQIPQVGPEWSDLPEAYTTLAFLAGATRRIRLGTLVTGAGYRNPALLGKMIATLDVLSGGRANAGLGAGWFERETKAYGWDVPTTEQRLDRLEDILQMLPLLWGPGSPSFEGKTFSVPEAICYPRPLQEHIPILVGGGGEKRTLRLVAEYADATNLMGDAATISHKLSVLHRHCAKVDRDPETILVSHFGNALLAADESDLQRRVGALKPNGLSGAQFAASVNAGVVDDHVGRFRELAEAGVQEAIVSLAGPAGPDDVAHFGSVIDAFSP